MAQKMLENLKTIAEIVATPWTVAIVDETFTVIARVDGICHEAGWCYATCSQCSNQVDIYNGLFWCSICNGVCRYPMIRFRIHLQVGDDSGNTTLTLYNHQPEQLIDSSANKLYIRVGIGHDGLPVEITRLTGKTFAFSIKMPDYYNQDYDFHHHRVVRLSEIEPVILVTSPPHPAKKVKRKRSKPADPSVDSDAMSSTNAAPLDTGGSICA